MRKIKSTIPNFAGFCLWKTLRLFLPELEVDPIFMIFLIAHFDSSQYLCSVMGAFRTIIGVSIAWVINVKLLPCPPKPGTLSCWLAERTENKNKEK